MTNDELNKFLHEQVMGECWHETTDTERATLRCDKCGNSYGGGYGFAHYLPNYCESLDAVSKAEDALIEKYSSTTEYAEALDSLCDDAPWMDAANWARVSARTRAEAIKLAMESP
jgi:hypothetical protein